MKRRPPKTGSLLIVVGLATALAGCTESAPPRFHIDMTQAVANQLSPAQQQSVADVLTAMFGTPDQPFVLPETGLDLRKLKMAAGPVWSDQQGDKHGLYRRHCAHCHGITGNGRGPTAIILNPYPRDYLAGVFKFKSTYNAMQPTDDDLRRVLHNGVPGTAMPSFALLAPDEIDALIEYVKYLSIRGQMGTALVNYVFEELDIDQPLDPAGDPEQREVIVQELLGDVVAAWDEAADGVIVPDPGSLPPADRSPAEIAASAAMGSLLFYGTDANCFSCHGPTGLGDGQQTDYDVWSKADQKFIDDTRALAESIQAQKAGLAELAGEDRQSAEQELQEKYQELAERQEVVAVLLPPRNAIPRNLRTGMYRGGQRPLDLFRRVNQGIAGTPMPAAGAASPGAKATLTEEQMWHIVDYIRSLPFEPASKPPPEKTVWY